MSLLKKLAFFGGLAALPALPALLGGCGHKGPLYIPAPGTPLTATTTTPAPAVSDNGGNAASGAKP